MQKNHNFIAQLILGMKLIHVWHNFGDAQVRLITDFVLRTDGLNQIHRRLLLTQVFKNESE